MKCAKTISSSMVLMLTSVVGIASPSRLTRQIAPVCAPGPMPGRCLGLQGRTATLMPCNEHSQTEGSQIVQAPSVRATPGCKPGSYTGARVAGSGIVVLKEADLEVTMVSSDVSSEAGNIMDTTSRPPSDPSVDRVTTPPENPLLASGPRPSPQRLLAVAVAAAVLGLAITLSFGYAEHDPKPHEVRLAVAAAPAVRAKVATGLQRAEPGAFDLESYPSVAAATQSVRSQTSAGALIMPPSGAVTIVTAGAEGVLQQQAITAALTAASQSMHRPTKLLDVAPLPSGDRSGLSTFVFGLGLLLPSVIGGVGIFLLGMRLRLWWRVAAATMFALLTACGGALAVGPVLGALTGASGALIGIGFLGALSFVLFVVALQAVVGLPGTALAAVAFIFVGNAVSGGPVPVGFLPGGFRQIASWLPNNAIVRGARDVVYFHGHDLAHPLLVLCLWPAVALCILAAVDLMHLSERRLRSHDRHDIYRTPAVTHLRRRLGRRRLRVEVVPATAAPHKRHR